MAKLSWTFKNQDAASYDFTSSVRYFTYTQGRRSVLDNYGGGRATITMANDNGQVAAASLAYRQRVNIRCAGSVTFRGWVLGIDYNDTPTGAASTATITLGDAWVLAGQQIAESQVLVYNDYQINEIALLQFYTGQFSQAAETSTIRGALTYAGDWATRLNEIVATDRGAFQTVLGIHVYFPLLYLQYQNVTAYSFGRTPSASVIGYQSFDRVQAIGNETYVNSAQVTPESLATQTHTNSQASTFGESTVTVATLNTTTAAGLNTARWIANSMADTTQQSFTIGVLDVAQTSLTNLESILQTVVNLELAYTVPGGSPTSERTLTEGVTVRGFNDRTEIEFYLSPFTYYNYFILNDAINGVLNSSRLGW